MADGDVTIRVADDTRQILRKLSAETGLTQKEIVGRLASDAWDGRSYEVNAQYRPLLQRGGGGVR